MFHFGTPWWAIVVRTTVVYAAILVGFRLLGKRELGQFTAFDLVLVLLIANAVQNAMVGPDFSLSGGLVAAAVLLVIDRGLTIARIRNPSVGRFFDSSPTIVVHDGKPLTGAMRRQGLSVDDLEMAIREHGLTKLSEVQLAVLEADGSISIVPVSSKTYHSRRRRARAIRKHD